MRLSFVLLFTLSLSTLALSQTSQGPTLGQLLTPTTAATTLEMANEHANAALQYERQQQWTAALNQYEEIIAKITSELSASTESQQNQMLYYVLGLADTDYARMLLNMGANQLFVKDYVQHLSAAEQAMQKALALASDGPVPAAQIYSALAVIKTYQADYAGARSEVESVRRLDPQDQAAAAAAEALKTVPRANLDLETHVRMYELSSRPINMAPAAGPPAAHSAAPSPALTEQQKTALLSFGEAIADIFYPKVVSVVKAGVDVVNAFSGQPQGKAKTP